MVLSTGRACLYTFFACSCFWSTLSGIAEEQGAPSALTVIVVSGNALPVAYDS